MRRITDAAAKPAKDRTATEAALAACFAAVVEPAPDPVDPKSKEGRP